MIKIRRDSGYADRFSAYKIVLDKNVIGQINNGQALEFNVPPGNHQLRLEIGWCRSNVIEFETDSVTVEFECGSSLRGWRIFMSLVYSTFLRNEYIWLKEKV